MSSVHITVFCKQGHESCSHTCSNPQCLSFHTHAQLLNNSVMWETIPKLEYHKIHDIDVYTRALLNQGYVPEAVPRNAQLFGKFGVHLYGKGGINECYSLEVWHHCKCCKKRFEHVVVIGKPGGGRSYPTAEGTDVPNESHQYIPYRQAPTTAEARILAEKADQLATTRNLNADETKTLYEQDKDWEIVNEDDGDWEII